MSRRGTAAALLAGACALGAASQASATTTEWSEWSTAGLSGSLAAPAGAQSVEAFVVGGGGGGARGGRGATVAATLPLGRSAYVAFAVGRNGGDALAGAPAAGVLFPGAGGEASGFTVCPRSFRCIGRAGGLLVAAGGGGSGGSSSLFAGGAGGDAGAAGGDGAGGEHAEAIGRGGAAAAAGAPGAGGASGTIPAGCSGVSTSSGGNGSATGGGAGAGTWGSVLPPWAAGGGGGSGSAGGGGGGAAATCAGAPAGAGGGGGGGASTVPAGGQLSLAPAGATPLVRVRYTIEEVAPALSIGAPAADASYLQGSVVRADYTCADESAGIRSCGGTVAVGTAVDTATPGRKIFSVTAVDNAGNTTTKTVAYTVRAPIAVASALRASARAVRFRLSRPAIVTITVLRRSTGGTPRWRTIARLRRTVAAGITSVRPGGRRRALAPGHYRVTVRPAGGRAVVVAFAVRAPGRR